jgi:hypothetical protein
MWNNSRACGVVHPAKSLESIFRTNFVNSRAAICVVSSDYFRPCLAMLGSIARHQPGVDLICYLIDCDEPPATFSFPVEDGAQESQVEVKVIGRKEFESPGLCQARQYFDLFEVACASKTAALRHVLESLRYEKVLYLDADFYCFAPFESVFSALEEKAFLLTPHCLAPLKLAGGHTDDYDLIKVGHINAGFLAASRHAVDLGILDWLEDRIVRYGFNHPSVGLFVDQKWVSCLSFFFPDSVGVLNNPGINVGHWNVAGRDLRREGSKLFTGQEDLMLFHFSGYKPEAPGLLTAYQHRPLPESSLPALGIALRSYAAALHRVRDLSCNWEVDHLFPVLPKKDRLAAYRKIHGKNTVHYQMNKELADGEALEKGMQDSRALAEFLDLPVWLKWLVRRVQGNSRSPRS